MAAEKNTVEIASLPLEEVEFAVNAFFGYLRDVLYHPKQAHLDPQQLAEPFRELAQGMIFIGKCIEEGRVLAHELSRGNLEATAKISSDNEIASGLKSLQATLKHISWQVGQIAKGDYNQRLSFAGSFSSAVNDMVTQLRERDAALRAEIFLTQLLADESRNTVMLLESITKGIEDLIIVVDRDTYEWLYTNHDPMRFLFNMECLKEIKELINQKVNECCIEMHERGIKDAPIQGQIELVANDDHPAQVFALTGYPIIWVDRKSAVIKLVDVTLREHEREELEQVAYYDALTNTYSRHYGMLTLERWIEEKQEFVLAFVDMDGLKYVNDTFGHVAGDEYIHATSDILSGFGKQATICRLGGDEFMLLIPKITAKQARAQLNKMRVELSKVADDKYDQSFSFGLVEVDKANTMSPSLLLSVADESMYEDKRNRKKERRAQY